MLALTEKEFQQIAERSSITHIALPFPESFRVTLMEYLTTSDNEIKDFPYSLDGMKNKPDEEDHYVIKELLNILIYALSRNIKIVFYGKMRALNLRENF